MATKFGDLGNPLLGRAAPNGDGSTMAQAYSSRASIAAALGAGDTVLMHQASVLRFGAGVGEVAFGTADLWAFGACRPARSAKVKLGIYEAAGFGTRKPVFDALIYDAPAAGGWLLVGGTTCWTKSFTYVNGNTLGMATFANCRLGDEKIFPVELRRKSAAADCVAEGDVHMTGNPATVTICTGSTLLSPDLYYEGIAFNAGVAGNTVWGYGVANVQFEDLMFAGGWFDISGGGASGATDENVNGYRLRSVMSRSSHFRISTYNTTGFAIGFYIFDSTCDSKARSGSGLQGNTEITTQNGLSVTGGAIDCGAVDMEFLGGFRHAAINIASSKWNAVSADFPRGINVYSRSRRNPKRIECVANEYSRAIGTTINGGAYIANFVVTGQAVASQASGVAVLDNITQMDFTRETDPNGAAQNYGVDCGWYIYGFVGNGSFWNYEVKDVVLKNSKIIDPTNYPIAANIIVGDASTDGGFKVYNTLISDLVPSARRDFGRATAITGPDASIVTVGYASAEVGRWIDVRNSVVLKANDSIWAIKAGSGVSNYTLWTGPNPTPAVTYPPINNGHNVTLAAAGIDAATYELLAGSEHIGAAPRLSRVDADARGRFRLNPTARGPAEPLFARTART